MNKREKQLLSKDKPNNTTENEIKACKLHAM